MRKRSVILMGVILAAPLLVVLCREVSARKLDRASLVADACQLADMIENTHPDPYLNGGGRIAFHRRLQSILAAIPSEGMTRTDFYRLLRPFVTAVGDAHTWLRDAYDDGSVGIPLYFGVVGTELYVLAVPEEQYRPLIGAVLVSVEGVPYRELLARLPAMVSADNEYQLLRNLAYDGILWSAPFLADLVPEWQDRGRVRLVLKHEDGREVEHVLQVPSRMPGKFISPGSRIERPRPGPEGFTYGFLDPDRKTALLVVDDMGAYREAFEMWQQHDREAAERSARDLYQRLHDSRPPRDLAEVIAGLPSATEVFRSLVRDMKTAGTTTLLVDVRRNGGGNSAMYNILLYFLYGRDVLLQAKLHKTEIRRLEHDPGASSAEPQYDFSGDWYTRSRQDSTAVTGFAAEFEHEVEEMPTFAAEYGSGEFENYYRPANVMVLSSPRTFSSGYTLMYYLYRAGAAIVGTPSAQAGNCFGETREFELEHSGLNGTISQKRYIYFHDDAEMGRVLQPRYPLTYETLRSYDFDLNAEILYALDISGKKQ